MVVIKPMRDPRRRLVDRRRHQEANIYKARGTRHGTRPGPSSQQYAPRRRPPARNETSPPYSPSVESRYYETGDYESESGRVQRRYPVPPSYPTPTGRSARPATRTPKVHSSSLRSMWFVNLTLLPPEEYDGNGEEFVAYETQLVVNYEKLERDVNSKVTRIIQKVMPDYAGGFYIEQDKALDRAVKKTRDWMAKIRSLSNPLHYSPPAIPTVRARLSEPLPGATEDPEMDEGEEDDDEDFAEHEQY